MALRAAATATAAVRARPAGSREGGGYRVDGDHRHWTHWSSREQSNRGRKSCVVAF